WYRTRLRSACDAPSRNCAGPPAPPYAALHPGDAAGCQHPGARGSTGTTRARPVVPQSGSADQSGKASAMRTPFHFSNFLNLGLDLKEDDDEREERERLDEREAENQEQEDSRTSSRVAGQRLSRRGGCLALTETAESSREGHSQAGRQWNPLRRRAVLTRILREGRRCYQHRGQ